MEPRPHDNSKYISRLEKAVENSLVAISKLKLENEQLRKDNAQLRSSLQLGGPVIMSAAAYSSHKSTYAPVAASLSRKNRTKLISVSENDDGSSKQKRAKHIKRIEDNNPMRGNSLTVSMESTDGMPVFIDNELDKIRVGLSMEVEPVEASASLSSDELPRLDDILDNLSDDSDAVTSVGSTSLDKPPRILLSSPSIKPGIAPVDLNDTDDILPPQEERAVIIPSQVDCAVPIVNKKGNISSLFTDGTTSVESIVSGLTSHTPEHIAKESFVSIRDFASHELESNAIYDSQSFSSALNDTMKRFVDILRLYSSKSRTGVSGCRDILQMFIRRLISGAQKRSRLSELRAVCFGNSQNEAEVNPVSTSTIFRTYQFLSTMVTLSSFKLGFVDLVEEFSCRVALLRVSFEDFFRDIAAGVYLGYCDHRRAENRDMTSLPFLEHLHRSFEIIAQVEGQASCEDVKETNICGMYANKSIHERLQSRSDPKMNPALALSLKLQARQTGAWKALDNLRMRSQRSCGSDYGLGYNICNGNALCSALLLIDDIVAKDENERPTMSSHIRIQDIVLPKSTNKEMKTRFEEVWKNLDLSSNYALHSAISFWSSLCEIFDCSFISYDYTRSSWTSGESGMGESSTTKISQLSNHLQSYMTSTAFVSSAYSTDFELSDFDLLFWGTSASPNAILDSSRLLDTIVINIDTINKSSDGKLVGFVREIASILSACVLEQFLFTCLVCAASFFHLFTSRGSPDMNPLMHDFVLTMIRLDTFCIEGIFAAIGTLNPIPQEISRWTTQLFRKLPLFCINLKRRKDRLKRFVDMAENLNAIVLRIDACDGLSESHQISPLEVNLSWDSTLNSSFDRNCVLNNSIPMTPSERGCIASHIKAWRIIANFGYDMDMSLGTSTHRIHSLAKVVQRSHYQRKEYKGYLNEIRKQISDWYIICEDDAIICTSEVSNDRLVSTIDKITRSIPETADICYLGYCIPQGTHPIKYNKLLIKPNYLWQLHSYMLTTRSAKKILSFLPVSEPVDNFLAHLIYDGKLEGYAVRKPIFKQQARYNDGKRSSDIRHSGNTKVRKQF